MVAFNLVDSSFTALEGLFEFCHAFFSVFRPFQGIEWIKGNYRLFCDYLRKEGAACL